MNQSLKAGLLPLYLKLYDDLLPRVRQGFDPLLREVRDGFHRRGVEIVPSDVCRVAAECRRATEAFAEQGAEAIVTLHLAYSPSLEALSSLEACGLPVVMLDTTADAEFGPETAADRILYNHGIHGLMDLANRLRRAEVPYWVVAGPLRESRIMDRAVEAVRAAAAARRLRNSRTLRIGAPFRGMGDFALRLTALRRWLGHAPEMVHPSELARRAPSIPPRQVAAEIADDRRRYDCRLPAATHEQSVRLGLALRERLEAGHYDALSFNFLDCARTAEEGGGVPFLEASKAMSRGLGYAGEGDVLTAALVGALSRCFGRTTFTEIFCPDWKRNRLFLSHMGEVNPDVLVAPPRLIEMQSPFIGSTPAAQVVGVIQPGPATYVNLAPEPDGALTLIASPVQMEADESRGDLAQRIRAWMRPPLPIGDFLEAYSRLGGTHHAAVALGDHAEAMEAMARFAGLGFVLLR